MDDTTQIDQLRAENEQLKIQNERLCQEVLALDTKLTETQCQFHDESHKQETVEQPVVQEEKKHEEEQ